jgi:hypothetical protein
MSYMVHGGYPLTVAYCVLIPSKCGEYVTIRIIGPGAGEYSRIACAKAGGR